MKHEARLLVTKQVDEVAAPVATSLHSSGAPGSLHMKVRGDKMTIHEQIADVSGCDGCSLIHQPFEVWLRTSSQSLLRVSDRDPLII